MRYKNNAQSGFAMLLAITVASVLLALGLSMLSVTTKQLTLSGTARESEIAFAAASAGLGCMTYHRRQSASDFFDNDTTGGPPSANCFGGGPDSGATQGKFDGTSGSDDYTNEFFYEYTWGASNNRCSQVYMYVMRADTDDDGGNYTLDFSGVSEAIGSKTCAAGDTCTAVIARGYNAPCSVVTTQATVQRELTSQF